MSVTPAVAGSPRIRTSDTPLRVHIMMFNGVEEQDFVGPLEAFALAEKLPKPITVSLVTTGRPGQITANFGTKIDVPHEWNPQNADVIVVPGGGYADRNGPGVSQVIKQKSTLEALAAAHKSGVLITALCSGVMILAAAPHNQGKELHDPQRSQSRPRR